MIEYIYNSLPTFMLVLVFFVRNEYRITKIETTLDLHVKNHNTFLSTLGRRRDAD